MEQSDALPLSLQAPELTAPSVQAAFTEMDDDGVPTPTHNEALCEICQLNRQHLSIPMSHYPHSPAPSLGDTPTTRPAESFEDGIKLGMRLQKESDDMLLNQYRKRLMRAEAQRDISRRWQYDVDRLERELAEARDMLLAVQISYEESVEAHTSLTGAESDDPGVNARTGIHEDSASQLTLGGAESNPGQGKVTETNHEAVDAETRPDSLYASTDTPIDLEDDDDDLFLWEQFKSLDKESQQSEEFWKSVYNIGNYNLSDPQPPNLHSTTGNVVKSQGSADEVQVDTCTADRQSPSTDHSDQGTGDDDHRDHSDSEDSTFSFVCVRETAATEGAQAVTASEE